MSKEDKSSSKEEAFATEDYDYIEENNFVTPIQQPLSTFSIYVDRAAYSNARRFIQIVCKFKKATNCCIFN